MIEIDYSAQVVGLTFHQGDLVTIPLTKTESPVSMVGRTWLAQVRASEGRASTLIETFTADTSAAASGLVLFSLSAAETDVLTPGTYWYEIARTDVERTMFRGPLTILPDTADL